MTFTSEFNENLANRVRSFLALAPVENLSLTLDGFGVNSALQYTVLSLIGIERLKRFAEINVISGSTYSWFCFWALKHGQLRPDQDELLSWDLNQLRLSGIRPFSTAAGLAIGRLTGQNRWLLPSASLKTTLEYLVDPAVSNARLSEFPQNLRFWLYDRNRKDLAIASARGEFAEMTVAELIRAAPNVPGVFQPFEFLGRGFSDPVYSPKRREMYNRLRGYKGPHLLSNPAADRVEGNLHYVKPHPFTDGKKMVQQDLLRFVLGRRNRIINESIANGLFNHEVKVL